MARPLSRSEAARNKILKALRAKRYGREEDAPGKAWTCWSNWTYDQRKHLLLVWCKLSKEQADIFCERPWYSLSLHVRRAVKRFFRQSPVLDYILGAMRYPERENADATKV